ncbi:MAG: ABC transporter permease [Rhodoferax sp.]|jgi:peptide/nickel transport system permease protein|nr:ABC transporter permease [Rhodoferax sp.]MBP9931051.1 ABC transporter permease [Rhodoferax sp.]HQX59589.1 ABC transporter permease [Burkholderiaceae bacterium]HQZ07311.1 ABC transporter permease [Burkholderiaceae bacterium]HRA62791.1 ABC transporter permease [Burkholderiaceae bacterium]
MSAAAHTASAPAAAQPSRRAAFVRRLLANRSFTIGLALVGAVVLMALLANFIAPFDPLKGNFKARMLAPGAEHWLGTDHFGRDILSRILHGAQVSLRIGFLVALFTAVAGAVIGATAGYFRSADGPVMRLMDAFMAFPPIILAIAISAVLGASVTNVVIALAIAATPHTARVVRASVMVVREMEYVEAARALGAGHARILLRHVLANAMAPLVVRVTYVFAIAILNEAVLSFIGVGPPPPTPTFGAIIANGRDFIVAAPWITVAPGMAILVSVLGLNMLGDGLRDVLDPRMAVTTR